MKLNKSEKEVLLNHIYSVIVNNNYNSSAYSETNGLTTKFSFEYKNNDNRIGVKIIFDETNMFFQKILKIEIDNNLIVNKVYFRCKKGSVYYKILSHFKLIGNNNQKGISYFVPDEKLRLLKVKKLQK